LTAIQIYDLIVDNTPDITLVIFDAYGYNSQQI